VGSPGPVSAGKESFHDSAILGRAADERLDPCCPKGCIGFDHAFIQRVIVSWAIYDFAAPTILFLAGVSTVGSDEGSVKSGLIRTAAVLLVLTASLLLD
jgi:hypothetical protein